MAKKLFIGSLAFSVDDKELEEAFAKYGKVISAVVINDRETGRSKGFGFVEMENDDEALKAIEGLNNQEIAGRSVVVNEARPREDRPRNNNRDFRR